jgi:hypothetical protein
VGARVWQIEKVDVPHKELMWVSRPSKLVIVSIIYTKGLALIPGLCQ